jgi:cytochrome c2
MRRTIIIFLLTAAAGHGQFVADSARGRALFETLSCVECHSIDGKGGSIGPDLGKIVDRGFTPASLAATMWNHAPAMWTSMKEKGIRAGDLNN